eukprot:2147096-Rhodomonas_salina.1
MDRDVGGIHASLVGSGPGKPHKVDIVREGGPAHRCGMVKSGIPSNESAMRCLVLTHAVLFSGDLLLEVDGNNVLSLPLLDIQSLIRGPVGSSVTLTLQSPGNRFPHKVKIQREAKTPTPTTPRSRVAAGHHSDPSPTAMVPVPSTRLDGSRPPPSRAGAGAGAGAGGRPHSTPLQGSPQKKEDRADVNAKAQHRSRAGRGQDLRSGGPRSGEAGRRARHPDLSMSDFDPTENDVQTSTAEDLSVALSPSPSACCCAMTCADTGRGSTRPCLMMTIRCFRRGSRSTRP